MEWFFQERWSLSATGNYMKRSYGGDDFFGISAWSVEPRWWFKGDGRFRWFYLGAYGQVGDYDVQNSRAAFDGTTGTFWGAGLSVGAAVPFPIAGGWRSASAAATVTPKSRIMCMKRPTTSSTAKARTTTGA